MLLLSPVMSEEDSVKWSSDYDLKWSDFKAESNPAIYEDSHSVIKYGFTWMVNSDKLNDDVVFFIENIQVSVEFNPLLSWVRDSEANDDLLKHEQGGFDLAEMVKRTHQKIFASKFYDKFFDTRGQNDAQRKQFAKEDSGRMISNEVNELNKIFLKKRQDYDIETNYGKNFDVQSKYDALFQKI